MEAGVDGSGLSGAPPEEPGEVVKDYDQAPRAIKIIRPQYPMEAFLKKVEGTVIVEILIDSTGRVARARVVQSVRLLDAAALQTVHQWVFSPALKQGRPVPTVAHAPIVFRIYNDAPALEQRRQSRATSGKGH